MNILLITTILVSLKRANEVVACCSRNRVPDDCMGLCMTYQSQAEIFMRTRSKSRSIGQQEEKDDTTHRHCWLHFETIIQCKKV